MLCVLPALLQNREGLSSLHLCSKSCSTKVNTTKGTYYLLFLRHTQPYSIHVCASALPLQSLPNGLRGLNTYSIWFHLPQNPKLCILISAKISTTDQLVWGMCCFASCSKSGRPYKRWLLFCSSLQTTSGTQERPGFCPALLFSALLPSEKAPVGYDGCALLCRYSSKRPSFDA